MPLVVVNLLSEEDSAWTKSLQEAFKTWSVTSLTNLADAKITDQANSDLRFAVLYPAPAFRLGTVMERGLAPGEALVQWEEEIEAVLDFSRDFDSRVDLVEVQRLPESLDALVNYISNAIGREVSAAGSLEKTAAAAPAKDPLFRLAALHLLSLPEPRSLQEDLGAQGAVALGNSEIVISAVNDAVISRRSVKKREEELRSRVKDQEAWLEGLRKENSQLLEQLFKTQEEQAALLESSERKLADMRERRMYHRDNAKARLAEVRSLRRELRSTRRQVEELSAVHSENDGSVAGLRASRDKFRQLSAERKRAVRQLNKDLKQLRAKNEALREKLDESRSEVRRMKASRSWKYTKVLRQMKGTE